MSDPVHYAAHGYDDPQWTGHDDWNGPGWYFWTETWDSRNGPYPTEEECRAKLKQYCEEVLGV